MARTMADILHDYEEAQQELEAVEGYKYDYPDYYNQAYQHWESCKAEYERACASGVQSVHDEVPWSPPSDGSSVPLMSIPPEEPSLICGGGDTVYIDMNRSLYIQAACGHEDGQRTAGPGGKLQVVTGAYDSDTITITNQGLAENVNWSGAGVEKVDGRTAKLAAGAPTVSKFWLFSIKPKVYTVSAELDGETQTITIEGYPDNQIKQAYNIDKNIADKLRMITSAANAATTWAGIEFEIDPPAGELAFAGAWAEVDGGKARWKFTASGTLTLWGISGKYPIGIERLTNPLSKIPGVGKELKKLVDGCFKAGLYLKAGGRLSLSAAYDSEKGADNTVGKLTAEIYIQVGAELKIASEDLISAELQAGASVQPYGALKWNDVGVYLSFGVDFGGISGTATIKMAWGFLTKSAAWTIVNPSPWLKETEPLYVWQ